MSVIAAWANFDDPTKSAVVGKIDTRAAAARPRRGKHAAP